MNHVQMVIEYIDTHGSITHLEAADNLRILNFTHVASLIDRKYFKLEKITWYRIMIGEVEQVVKKRPEQEHKVIRKWIEYKRRYKK